MTLFSLARRNVAGNLRSYLLYFLSMGFSVVIYFTFVSMRYSKEIAANTEKWAGIQSVFTQASIMLILFVAAFIWYSNSFFTRRRKQEVGLYSLLGLRKRTIARMLFYENMLMGALAMVAGIAVGALLSKLFTMIFLWLLDSAVQVTFSLSGEAVLNTLLVFTVIIGIASLQGYRLIYRFRLIELFRAEKEGEQAPKVSVAAAVASVVLLGFGYWLVFQPIHTNAAFARNFLLLFGSLALGTYLLFRSVVAYLLKLAQKDKTRYYRGLNTIVVSQLAYRVRGNTRTFTIIALLSAFTLCAVTVGTSSYYTIAKEADAEAPFSYAHIALGEPFDSGVRELIEADGAHPVTASLDLPVVVLEADLGKLEYTPSGYEKDRVPVKLVSAALYNQASAALGRDRMPEVADGEAVLVIPLYTSFTADDVKGFEIGIPFAQGQNEGRNEGQRNDRGEANDVGGNDGAGEGREIRTLEIVGAIEGRIVPWSFPDVMFVVADGLYAELAARTTPVVYKSYKVRDQGSTAETTAALRDMGMGTEESALSSYYYQFRLGIESAGMNIFTLGFLGLVFLAATGSMIYFKQLTDAHADKRRYEILRMIGVSRRAVRTAVARQTLFVFALPLLVGILHSVMVLKALANIQLIESDWLPIACSIGAYAAIYAVYYAMCVRSFDRIVNR